MPLSPLIRCNNTMTCRFFLMLFILAIASLVLLLLIKQERKRARAKRLPPGPKKLPLIGNLHQIVGDSPHRSLQRLSEEHGPLMFLQLGSVPTLVISSAEVARDIFRIHDVIFSGRPELYSAKKLSYNCNNISFAPYGEYWREVRKIAILELLSSKRVQSFEAMRAEEVALMLEFIAQSSEAINLSRLALLLTNNTVCRATFGKKYDNGRESGSSRFDELLRETQTLLGKYNIADFFPWMGWLNKFNGLNASLEKTFRKLDKLYDEEIQYHLDPSRSKPENEDLVDVLLRIRNDASQVITLTDEQIKAVLTDMFIAGTDTSAATLIWIMTELVRNPSVMRRAQKEVRERMRGKVNVQEGDLSELLYLKLVVKEALRLHPPVPLLVPREATKDCMIGEYRIASGTRVFINAKAIATDPKYWEKPYEFQPERFLISSVDFKGQNFELIPFGVGRRGCPGMNFAIRLIELAVANLLYRFDWKLPPGMTSDDLDMDEATGLTVHKKSPLCLVATSANL